MSSSISSIFNGRRRRQPSNPPSPAFRHSSYHQHTIQFSYIPTHTRDVKPQETMPTRLPSREAPVENVQIFLYDLLCYKGHGIVQKWPQWILETVANWDGSGAVLRNFTGDFELLCPFVAGSAMLDENCKYVHRAEPDCRRKIGYAIESTIKRLKMKEDEGERSHVEWQRVLVGNPPSGRRPSQYVSMTPDMAYDSASMARSYTPSFRTPNVILQKQQQQPAFHGHNPYSYNMAWNASHNIPQNMLQNISQNIPQNMPWNISHDMLHNMAQDPPMNTQYSPSLSLLPVSRQPSQNEMHYFSTSSSGTPLSQSGGSLSCESPSTERTSPPESIEDGMETPRPASIASISRQTTPLAQGGLAQADLPPSVPSRSDSSSVVSRISRRGSNQQTLNIPSRLSTHSEVDVGSRAQTPLPPHPPRPTTAQQRYRPVTTKGPPPAAFNTRYAPTGGLRHRRSVGVDGVRRNNPQASPSTPILSHHSSSTSIPGLPQQKTGSSLHRKAMDCVHAEHRGRNPSIITEPPPGHGDVIDTTSTPQKRSVSLFRSLTHNFRPKRTALVDSYALAQGAYTVSTAESSAKRTEVGRRDPMHRQVMVPNIRDHGREHMGPSMRQINRETGLTVPTLYERIELRESMRGNKPTRQRL